MESTGWGYLWSSVWACALAWLSIDCHSVVVNWTGYSENCHLRIFSDHFCWNILWITTLLEFYHFFFLFFFFFCVVLFSLIGSRILFFPFLPPLPNILFPLPSPFSLLPVYRQHRYSFTSFIQMHQHPFIFRVEYDGRLLSLHLSSFTNWRSLYTKHSLETVAFAIVAFGHSTN